MSLELKTCRMRLVSGTQALAEAELSELGKLADLLGASIPPSWPPEILREVLPTFLESCRRMRNYGPWTLGWYGVLKEDDTAVLCGSVGFKGPPNTQGMVEIGYSVIPEYQGRGIASEMVDALSRWALSCPEIQLVEAEVLTDNPASMRVLEKVGFTQSGPDQSGAVRFHLSEESKQACNHH